MIERTLEADQFTNKGIVTAVGFVALYREHGIEIEFCVIIVLVIFFDETCAGEPMSGYSHEA
jgi:hypothetical protein